MKRSELINNLNNSHEILKRLNDTSHAFFAATDVEEFIELDNEELFQLYKTVSPYVRDSFNNSVAAAKPLINGQLASISRKLDVHKRTFDNYMDGRPSSPILMNQILKHMLEAVEAKEQQFNHFNYASINS